MPFGVRTTVPHGSTRAINSFIYAVMQREKKYNSAVGGTDKGVKVTSQHYGDSLCRTIRERHVPLRE